MEQFIAKCANSQDPQKLADVLEKIGEIGLDVPLEELEEHIKQRLAEKDKLEQTHELDGKLERMADFSFWGEAVARVMGYKPMDF